MKNHLYYGDNLQVLRDSIASESVDLVYLDPPFNSNSNYNILFKSPEGSQSHAQIEAFEDTWHWEHQAENAFDEVMQSGHSHAAEMLRAMRSFLGENDMMAYLTMMTIRIIELRRVLKDTGSLYLHCDPTASHYLKIILDGIFGAENYRNEITWKRTSAHNSAKRWGPVHDTLFFYTKGEKFTWNAVKLPFNEEYITSVYKHKDERGFFKTSDLTGAGIRRGDSGLPWKNVDPTSKKRHWAIPLQLLNEVATSEEIASMTTQQKLDKLDQYSLLYWPKKGSTPLYKKYLYPESGLSLSDVIADIPPLSSQSRERLGYPTQKPLALLERIIMASSNEGDVVLDPFCGCGTAVHASEKLRRKWIGIDITNLAVSLIEKRLKDAFSDITFQVHGTPKDADGARALAEADKYQFQWWAVSLVNAVPYGGKKKGADGGIDGLIYFKPDGRTTEKAIVSVKGGANVGVPMIRDLAHVIDREKAKIGVFITLAEPTKPMLTEAIKAGYYETEYGKYPKLQILTIEELFAGKQPHIPLIDSSAFKKAATESRAIQSKLDF
jgi:DNA modification methylase